MNEILDHLFKRAERIASLSRDTSTKVGAVLVSHHDEIIYSACNDIPDDVIDMPARRERPLKYKFVCHAESNVICLAARNGKSTRNAYIVTTHHPCSDCAKLIIQAGIRVVYWDKGEFVGDWAEDLNISATMLREAGIKMVHRERKDS